MECAYYFDFCQVASLSQCHALSEENSREGRGGRHLEGDELPFSPLERWALCSDSAMHFQEQP